MVNTYRLVNPHIEGQMKSKIKAKNSEEAAQIFYKNLSEHFNNSVPKFLFTIQKGSSGEGKYYHFNVTEERDDEEVSFKVSPYKIKGEEAALKTFQGKLNDFKKKQAGGKHRSRKSKSDDSSDSDSDTSSDYYVRARSYMPNNQPIYYWWYDPYLYRTSSVYIPTFYSYLTPYIQLSLELNP